MSEIPDPESYTDDYERNMQLVPRATQLSLAPNRSQVVHNIPNDTAEARIILANIGTRPDAAVDDMVGKVINLRYAHLKMVELTDPQSGEIRPAIRTVLVDDKGKKYGCVSNGVIGCINQITEAYGPGPWLPFVGVEVNKVKMKIRGHLFELKVVSEPTETLKSRSK